MLPPSLHFFTILTLDQVHSQSNLNTHSQNPSPVLTPTTPFPNVISPNRELHPLKQKYSFFTITPHPYFAHTTYSYTPSPYAPTFTFIHIPSYPHVHNFTYLHVHIQACTQLPTPTPLYPYYNPTSLNPTPQPNLHKFT
jgi:hypothetical protein